MVDAVNVVDGEVLGGGNGFADAGGDGFTEDVEGEVSDGRAGFVGIEKGESGLPDAGALEVDVGHVLSADVEVSVEEAVVVEMWGDALDFAIFGVAAEPVLPPGTFQAVEADGDVGVGEGFAIGGGDGEGEAVFADDEFAGAVEGVVPREFAQGCVGVVEEKPGGDGGGEGKGEGEDEDPGAAEVGVSELG